MADPTLGSLRRLTVSNPFPRGYIRVQAETDAELAHFILSASGWRKVFADSENDDRPEISGANKELVAVAGYAFAAYITKKSAARPLAVALATDTRPTSPGIAGVLARVLLSEGIAIRYLGVAAAPEIMSYVRSAQLDAFLFVTASHNPIGHNGLKFGLSDGAVMGAGEAQQLISSFRQIIANTPACRQIVLSAAAVDESQLSALDRLSDRWKTEALGAYLDFTTEIGTMTPDPVLQEQRLRPIREAAGRRRIGVVADLNGSARALSIDRQLMERLGVRFAAINDKPGEIVHAILPEGEALEPCRRELEALHAQDRGFLIGYLPDNDGDRGNIVYIDPRSGKAEILRAQEVFALSCMAELSYLVSIGALTYRESGKAQQRHAVIVNGPTSLRIDAIAKAFDVRVFRSEVGEANVVNLARDSMDSGFQVRIMGEGSNGGNITHPARVRDPLMTVMAFLRLLLIESRPGAPGLYEIWCRRSGHPFDPAAGIREMLESLPAFVTTDVNSPSAIVDIETNDHVRLKEAYEEIFLNEWDERKREFARQLGIHTWEEINYEGTNEIHGFGKSYRSGKQRGGLKILFKDDSGGKVAFIWMRGSGTEPVFRVIADVKGEDRELERALLEWHVSMIRRADAKVRQSVSVSG